MRSGRNVLEDTLCHDEDADLLGWESPTYGELRSAISLLHHVYSPLPVRIVTLILAAEEFQFRQTDKSLIVSRGSSEIYQVSLALVQTGKVSG
jgi:hypothetical protein